MTIRNLLSIVSDGTEVTITVNPMLNKDAEIRKTLIEFFTNPNFLGLSKESAEKIMDDAK